MNVIPRRFASIRIGDNDEFVIALVFGAQIWQSDLKNQTRHTKQQRNLLILYDSVSFRKNLNSNSLCWTRRKNNLFNNLFGDMPGQCRVWRWRAARNDDEGTKNEETGGSGREFGVERALNRLRFVICSRAPQLPWAPVSGIAFKLILYNWA